MITYLFSTIPPVQSSEELKKHYFLPIRDVLRDYDYSDYEPMHGGLDLKNEEMEEWITKEQKALLKIALEGISQ